MKTKKLLAVLFVGAALTIVGCASRSESPRRWLGRALLATNETPASEDRDEIIAFYLAESLAAADMHSEAVATAESVADYEKRSYAFIDIVRAYAKVGSFSRALATARQMEDAEGRAFALSYLAAAQAKAGRTNDAENTLDYAAASARKIEDDWYRAAELARVARTYAGMGEYSRAVTFSETIANPYLRVQALNDIATAQAKAGNRQDALKTFTRAIEIARDAKDYPALRDIVGAQCSSEMLVEAKTTATLMVANPRQHGSALSNIAEAQRKTGLFADAVVTAKTIPDNDILDFRSWELMKIADAQAKQSLFTDALATAEHIDQLRYKAWTLGLIARRQASAGNTDEANKTFDYALAVTEQMPYKSDALCDVVECLAKAGMLDRAVAVERTITDTWRNEVARCAIAIAYAQNGMFDEAMTTAGEIQDEYMKWRAYSGIAVSAARAGLFAESIEIAKHIPTQHVRAFRDIAIAHIEKGGPQAACESFESLKTQSPNTKAWFCIGAANALTAQQKGK